MRPWLKYGAAVASVALAIAVLELVGSSDNGANAAQILLLVLLFDARFCGAGPAVVASLGAMAGFVHYFITPSGFEFGDPNDWLSLGAFVVMAVVGGELASRAERRAAEAQLGRQEIARLYQELQMAFDRASEAEAARRSEQLKAALLDALTHNLRTPLTSIKASVTALLGAHAWPDAAALPQEGQRELLEVIDEESDRLNRFIEGLSTAGTSDGSQPIRLGAASVGDIVRAALVRAGTLTRDHPIRVSVDDTLPRIAVDAAAVTEVLYILLDNASKYSPPGTGIDVAAVDEGRGVVRLDVSDEGPGIPADLRERVFEKFFRIPARESRDPRRGGIGLGLSIARRLVEAQSGRMWIEEPPSGRGTRVAITLPVMEEANRPAQPAPAAMVEG
jgi:K+-sensing histidine kinase KdpD